MTGSNFNHDSSRIADANRSWQAACNAAVTGWDKSNEFIVALVASGKKNNPESFKIQWSKNDVDWNDLTNSGELVQGTNTVLVNGNPVGSLCGCASATVEQSEEVEGDNTTEALVVAATDNCIEVQVAVDPSNGTPLQTYYFRLYSVTASAALGTAGATLTLAAGAAWRQLQYFSEPPSTGWNKLKFASEPPVPGAWNKLLYEGEGE